LKVTNAGEVTATITGMAVSGDFAQTTDCGASLAAHDTCRIRLSFRPTATGKLAGNLTLRDDAANSPQVVYLSGKGNRH